MESKKLQTRLVDGVIKPNSAYADIYFYEALEHGTRIAHELLDPSRKTPETPLEHEQREIIRGLDKQVSRLAIYIDADSHNMVANNLLLAAVEARINAAPYIQED